ncbi:hypothetical protein CCH79_00013759 [Gambusia affinis]|uniref:Uncharacterized protein n=1 Tax=Gambusia affinis TaxID=33528 RepID=A0A315VSX6_GAMAF|nr:hypothetical protein CCH79_00013759 [Gambusia affinis]
MRGRGGTGEEDARSCAKFSSPVKICSPCVGSAHCSQRGGSGGSDHFHGSSDRFLGYRSLVIQACHCGALEDRDNSGVLKLERTGASNSEVLKMFQTVLKHWYCPYSPQYPTWDTVGACSLTGVDFLEGFSHICCDHTERRITRR